MICTCTVLLQDIGSEDIDLPFLITHFIIEVSFNDTDLQNTSHNEHAVIVLTHPLIDIYKKRWFLADISYK